MAQISQDVGREIGILVDRKGIVRYVLCGERDSILIPDLSAQRRGPGRLKGLRCIHTHLRIGKGLDSEDLTDLALLRLDSMVAIDVENGLPSKIHLAHLLPPNQEGKKWEIHEFRDVQSIKIPFASFIKSLEDEMQHAFGGKILDGGERAILVHASPYPRNIRERSMRELELLARSAGVEVVDMVHQRIRKYHPGHLIGLGKLRQILIDGLYLGATLVIFDQNLTPVQVNKISEMVDLKVIDRTQLILDIFAKRARSREGKIQVELAQLKYLLPRLVGKGTAMSRLSGGIGGRGPGEKKLEIDRRRVKQRINSLEKDLEKIAKRRLERRKRRLRSGKVFKVSLVGYTNAGKSTLLNTLTGANVLSEDKVFATLDPKSSRFFIRGLGQDIVISDTVGFIRDMPEGLKAAFKSTLEELEDADLILHVVDLTSPDWQGDKEAVEEILREMAIDDIPVLTCYNKIDAVEDEDIRRLPKDAVTISAKKGYGLEELINRIFPSTQN
ncbi:GTP-binding protein HflX [Dissulfuribacter thermophilus]|uniref:GTPase HflX n=1 Tax=Dissulfuribacter thermophilus TaxID=1156395 RepID=A0A1B9F801_9BACT|nr:GTP-binding protein HflX [Dissulfuribacter thermophilus]